jgi:hypothetical protein
MTYGCCSMVHLTLSIYFKINLIILNYISGMTVNLEINAALFQSFMLLTT